MSSEIVSYEFKDGVATITMDDGKNNLVTPPLLKQVNAALDQAEKDNAVVILTGRPDVFCAGFDLKVLRSGVKDAWMMLIGGFELGARLLAFPTPVVVACTGHAMAMGSFILLSADDRIGTRGDYKIQANEVAIGLTVPHSAMEICRGRLNPGHFSRAVLLSECYNPETAVDAGFLDTVVDADDLMATARARAAEYAELDLAAHYGSKMRLRGDQLTAIKKGLAKDRMDFVGMGVQRVVGQILKRGG